MALHKQVMTRVFSYAGVQLPDPDPTMSVDEVRDFFASTGRPELTSAEVRGPEVVGNDQVFTLHRITGTKGAARAPLSLTRRADRRDRRESGQALERLSAKSTGATLPALPVPEAQALTRLALNQGDAPVYLPSGGTPWIG